MKPVPPLLRRGLPLLVFAATFATFARTIGFDFVADWDDGRNVVDNDGFRGFGPAQLEWMLTARTMGHWHPLTWLSFAIDDAIAGRAPWLHHATNLLLHAVNAVLCQRVILRLLAFVHPGGPVLHLAATAGALLFALHPLRVESVAWITERRDVLSGAFFLATILCWLRIRDGRRWYWLALAACAASLLAKAWGITIPVLLLLLDAWPLRRWSLAGRTFRAERGLLLEKLPFLLLAAGTAWLAHLAQSEAGARLGWDAHGFGHRLLQACYGLWFYPLKTLVPAGLSPIYELWPGTDFGAPEFTLAAIGTMLAALVLLAIHRSHPAIATAVACYAVTVSPVLGFHQSGPQLVADRYSYLACIPFAALAAGWLARRPRWLPLAWIAVALLALLSVLQSPFWRDSRSLWRRTLAVEPQNGFAAYNLARLEINDGVERMRAGDRAAGKRMQQEALRLLAIAQLRWPNDPDTLSSIGIALLNLHEPSGGGYERALPYWLRAVQLAPGHPDATNALAAVQRDRPELLRGR